MESGKRPSIILPAARELLTCGKLVDTSSWQGVKSEQFKTVELTDYLFRYVIPNSLDKLKDQVRPNLPWADSHFQERTCGKPLNPGLQYLNWPFYKKDEFRTEHGKFTHTYMERFWPKFAGVPFGDTFGVPTHGIRYPYGDLEDVIKLLLKDPFTRQAYFPIWFPEDTGAVHGGRVPCSLGYHFLYRNNELNIFYAIRSCDLLRHFQDDIYLACKLLFWVLKELNYNNPTFWAKAKPGMLSMHIYSLHIFENDLEVLKYKIKAGTL